VSDALTMTARCVRLTRRQLDALLTSLLLPVLLMLLFACLFGGAIHTGTRYVTYVVPGVLLLCAGYGASLTAVSVSQDMIFRQQPLAVGQGALEERHRLGEPRAVAAAAGLAVGDHGRGVSART